MQYTLLNAYEHNSEPDKDQFAMKRALNGIHITQKMNWPSLFFIIQFRKPCFA